jgi:quercetin dioxygenase-like cupin family protein
MSDTQPPADAAATSRDGDAVEVADVTPAADVRPVDLRDYVDFSQGAARRVRVFATDHLAQDLWCIEPQQSTGVMQYPDADVSYTVVGGRSWFVTEAGEVGLDPMGALLVPAGTVHGIDNRGADPLIVAAAMSPPDTRNEDEPVSDAALAVRDDSQYGRLGRRVKGAFGKLLGG